MARSGPFPGSPHPDAPRLEPATHGIGWIPHYTPGPVAPEPPPPELDPLDALAARLDALKADCIDRVRAAENTGFAIMGRAELVALNADLSEVRRLNAALFHHQRLSTVAAWPEPVLPTNMLLGPRDVLPVLRAALDVVRICQSRRDRRYG